MDASVAAIIPTKNRPNFLREAILSAIEQTYNDIDIIVVDDGNTDQTARIIDSISEYKGQKTVRHIRHGFAEGPANARNIGLEKTESQFVAFLDDDDVWLPEKTERQVNLLKQADDNVALVYTGFHSRTPTGKHLHTRRPLSEGDLYEKLLVEDIIGPPSTVLARRDWIEESGGFDVSFQHHEDWDLYLRIAENARFRVVSEPLVERTIHEGAASNAVPRAISYRERLLNRHCEELQKRRLHSTAWERHFRSAGIMACRNGDIAHGRELFAKALEKEITILGAVLFASTFFGSTGFNGLRRLKQEFNKSRLK